MHGQALHVAVMHVLMGATRPHTPTPPRAFRSRITETKICEGVSEEEELDN